MGMDFTKYQQLATDFNNRFGVNFSYQDFETEVLRDKYVSEGFANSRSNISVENSKYVSEFVKLFDQAFVNSVNRKIEPFTPEEMVQEYTKMMNGYRAACKDHGEELSQNWVSGSTLMRNVNSEMKDVAENRQEFIEGEYLRGAFRIRDMRREAKRMRDDHVDDPEKLSAIWNYANALQKINESRPRWWRIIFFARNAAEQREAHNMREIVTQGLREYDSKNGRVANSGFLAMQKALNEPTIKNLKDSIKSAYRSFASKEAAERSKNEKKLADESTKKLENSGDIVEKEILFDDDSVRKNISFIVEEDLKISLLDDKSGEKIEEAQRIIDSKQKVD